MTNHECNEECVKNFDGLLASGDVSTGSISGATFKNKAVQYSVLKYRGVAYEYNPTNVAMLAGEIGGKYRGVPWQQRIPQIDQVTQPSVDLKYRGVPYRQGAVKLTNIEAEPTKDPLSGEGMGTKPGSERMEHY